VDVHLYLPDRLHSRLVNRDDLDLNLSALLQDAVERILDEECRHERTRVVCAECGAGVVPPHDDAGETPQDHAHGGDVLVFSPQDHAGETPQEYPQL